MAKGMATKGDFVSFFPSIIGEDRVDLGYTDYSFAYMHYMWQIRRRLLTWFTVNGMPEWDYEYINRVIIDEGFVAIVKTDKYGIIPQRAGLGGRNIYQKPNKVIVHNEFLDGEFDIGVDADILYLQADASGFPARVTYPYYHAGRLANADCTLDTNLINSRTAHIFLVDNPQEEKSAKAFFDELTAGKPGIFMRGANGLKDAGFEHETLSIRNIFMGKEILDAKAGIKQELAEDLGMDSSPIQKKERVNMAETESNVQYTANSIGDLKANLQRCIDSCNRTFGMSWTVQWNYDVLKTAKCMDDESEDGEYSDTGSDGKGGDN